MKELIVNADDFGISECVDAAIDYCFMNKMIDSTSIIVNMPEFEKAVILSRNNDYFDRVGLHINLVEGIPLTERIKHSPLCTDGEFNGRITKNKRYWFFWGIKEIKAVYYEIEAQMDRYLDCGFSLRHLDSHQHSHLLPGVFLCVIHLARRKDFDSIRLARLMPSSNSSFMSRIYKTGLNYLIKKYNYMHNKNCFLNVDYADGLAGLEKELEMNGNKNIGMSVVETWIHPSFKGNELVNLYYTGKINLSEVSKLKKGEI